MIRFFMLIVSMFIMPMACWAMSDYTPPVYGRPTLYGEYEITKSDVARAANIYGNAPRAITADASAKNAVAKHPVKAKKVKPKKSKARKSSARAGKKVPGIAPQPKPAQVIELASAPVFEEVVRKDVKEEAPVPEVPKTNIPSDYAAEIKGALSNKYDVSSYCVSVSAGDGKIPDGFVLMPGRPDLMSCTGK